MSELATDPVCGMQVKAGQHAVEYMQISHSFCSLQCRERFLANPHLYVGAPGHMAPKSAGLEVVKQRRLRLAQALLPAQGDALCAALQAMMGVQSVSVEGNCITIVYDLLQAIEV